MADSGVTPTPAPTPALSTAGPATERLRWWRRARQRLFSPFWAVPATWCLVAVLAGLALPEIGPERSAWMPFLFTAGADGARTVLATIAGAMISVTGLVFSITIVVLQLASSQFTPRVVRTFLDDRLTQHTLGVFAASFLYALTVLRSVGDPVPAQESGAPVPQFAVTVAFLLVLGAVAMFLAFIHHIANSISVTEIVHQVADETRGLLKRSIARRADLPETPPELPELRRQTVARAQCSGRLDTVDLELLTRCAAEREARIELLYPLGSFVPAGAPIAMIRFDADDGSDWDALISRGIGLKRERSTAQDVTYGLRRLVDIAERALSPGTNDPTTAVQVLDELHDILRVIAAAPDPYPVQHDRDGLPRLITSEWTFAQYLDLAVDEIAHWGRSTLQIPRRLREMLTDLAVAAAPAHEPVVRAKLEELEQLPAA